MTFLLESVRKIWSAMTMSCALWVAGVFFFALLSGTTTQADEYRVDHILVLERGIFQASSRGPSTVHSTLGFVATVRDISLIRSTTAIPARRSLRFGLRYVVIGSSVGDPVKVRLVTRFPEAGLFDPASGVRHYQSEYTIRAVIGAPAYREFMFDHPWEIVTGEWVFEFWQADRKIGMQTFCVLDAETAPRHAPLPSANCGPLIGRLSPIPGLLTNARSS